MVLICLPKVYTVILDIFRVQSTQERLRMLTYGISQRAELDRIPRFNNSFFHGISI